MRSFKIIKKQRGLTLIELMIAMLLGVVVIVGATRGLGVLAMSNRIQNNNATLQSDADSALSYISFKMRNALSTPCERISLLKFDKMSVHPLSGAAKKNDGVTETIATQDAAVIEGLLDAKNEGGKKVSDRQGNTVLVGGGIGITQKKLSGSIGNVNNPSTDNITVISAENRLYIDQDINLESRSISIPGKFPKAKGGNETLYAVTDCGFMDVFRANRSETTSKTTLTLRSGDFIDRQYLASSGMVSTVSVSEILVNNDRGLVSKSFFKKSAGSLMDNVELIRVVFGIDTDRDGITDRYVTAKQLNTIGSNDIISADVYIMVRIPTENRAVSESYTLEMPNTSSNISTSNFMQKFTIEDQIQRQVFVRSVVFRNNAIIYK